MCILHLRFTHELGAGEIDLARIEVLGEKIDELSIPFLLPADPFKLVAELENVHLAVGEACSGCLNRLGEVFTQIGKEELSKKGEIAFVVGKGVEPVAGRKNALMGKCTAQYRDGGIYLRDCPPMVPDIKQAIQYAAGEIAERVYSWDAAEMADDAGM